MLATCKSLQIERMSGRDLTVVLSTGLLGPEKSKEDGTGREIVECHLPSARTFDSF